MQQLRLKASSLYNLEFMVNRDGATATDIENLCALVQNVVYDKFEILLEPEVEILRQELQMPDYRLKYDFHTHTIFSHGKGTIEQNVMRAREIGLAAIAISFGTAGKKS